LFLLGEFQTTPGILLLHSEIVKEFVCQNLVTSPDPLGKCSQGRVDSAVILKERIFSWGHEEDDECPLQHIHIMILDLAW
jgi:hypothetical protein